MVRYGTPFVSPADSSGTIWAPAGKHQATATRTREKKHSMFALARGSGLGAVKVLAPTLQRVREDGTKGPHERAAPGWSVEG